MDKKKKKVLIAYLIISITVILGIFLLNIIGAKTGLKDALLAAAMFGLPICVFGGGVGIMMVFRSDADEAYEKGDVDDITRKNWENTYKMQR